MRDYVRAEHARGAAYQCDQIVGVGVNLMVEFRSYAKFVAYSRMLALMLALRLYLNILTNPC